MPIRDVDLQAILLDSQSGQGRKSLVKWDDAEKVLDELCDYTLLNYEAQCRGRNTYHSWLLWQLAQGWMKLFRLECKAKLAALLYTHARKPRGLQIVNTSEWGKKPHSKNEYGVEFGVFNGKQCWKRPVGRPPLTPNERKRRERARWKRNNEKRYKGRWRWKHHKESPKLPTVRSHHVGHGTGKFKKPQRRGKDAGLKGIIRAAVERFTDAVKDEAGDFLKKRALEILKKVGEPTASGQGVETLEDLAHYGP